MLIVIVLYGPIHCPSKLVHSTR